MQIITKTRPESNQLEAERLRRSEQVIYSAGCQGSGPDRRKPAVVKLINSSVITEGVGLEATGEKNSSRSDFTAFKYLMVSWLIFNKPIKMLHKPNIDCVVLFDWS